LSYSFESFKVINCILWNSLSLNTTYSHFFMCVPRFKKKRMLMEIQFKVLDTHCSTRECGPMGVFVLKMKGSLGLLVLGGRRGDVVCFLSVFPTPTLRPSKAPFVLLRCVATYFLLMHPLFLPLFLSSFKPPWSATTRGRMNGRTSPR